MTGPIRRGAFRDLVHEHAGINAPASEPPPAESYPARFGARELSAAASRALAAPTTRPVVRAWAGSAIGAIRAWVVAVDEGASLRSTSDPDRARRVQTSSDPSLGGREHDRIERYATVARAVGAARERVLVLSAACPVLDPDQALYVALVAIAGKLVPRTVDARGRALRVPILVRMPQTDSGAAEHAREIFGAGVDVEHVRALRHHVIDTVRVALLASGELRAAGSAERRGFAADPAARVRS